MKTKSLLLLFVIVLTSFNSCDNKEEKEIYSLKGKTYSYTYETERNTVTDIFKFETLSRGVAIFHLITNENEEFISEDQFVYAYDHPYVEITTIATKEQESYKLRGRVDFKKLRLSNEEGLTVTLTEI